MMLIQIAGPCCKGVRCHAIFENDETGALVVQGQRLIADHRALLTLGDDEEAIEVPRELLFELATRLRR